MRIVIIASHYFPVNDVSSLRIHSYAKSLSDSGNMVTVLIVYPPSEGITKPGNFEGVNYAYVYASTNTLAMQNKIAKRIRGFLKIRRYIKQKSIECILTYHDNFWTNIFIRFFVRSKNIPFIVDKTEYPYGYFKMSKFKRIVTDLNFKLFTGIIAITKELKSFYLKYTQSVFLLPMTISPDRYNGYKKETSPNPYVALTFGTHNRDGLFESVIAFHRYLNICEVDPYDLLLIGDFQLLCKKFPECRKIAEYIVSNDLERKVHFLGRQSIDKVPELLINASCLLTTPSKFSSGGFPTKLGEYLLSSVPVVATNAGEISDYLRNRYDIFLSEVGDLDDVAKNILYVQMNAEESKNVGERGRKTAEIKFNASSYTSALIAFIRSLRKANI